jgi:large subunit ribosomal protein L13
MKIVFDAEGCIVGRLATIAAKELLKGNNVYIVNAEKALISGNPKYVIDVWQTKIARGHPYKGPFYPKQPDRIIKRVIRGMLPYKKWRGKQAFKRLRVYVSVPQELKESALKPQKAVSKIKKGISLGELSLKCGAKKLW